MARKTGSKNLSEEDKLNMCAIIAPHLKFRESNEDLLLRLEDKGFNVGINTLIELKNHLKTGLKDRFKEIGEYELAQEHDYAIQMMKYLMTQMKESLAYCKDESEKVRVINQMQSIQKDLIDYYGSSDIVENVFKYFNEDKEETKEEKVKDVKKEVKKKDINKAKKHKLLTQF